MCLLIFAGGMAKVKQWREKIIRSDAGKELTGVCRPWNMNASWVLIHWIGLKGNVVRYDNATAAPATVSGPSITYATGDKPGRRNAFETTSQETCL